MADAPARFKDLCLDARDHQALADWWCAAMGYVRRDEVEPPEDGWTRPADWPVPIVDPTGAGPLIWIVPVPEAKTVKNRLHLDVVVEDVEAAAARVVELGGSVALDAHREYGFSWRLATDPEGNEFSDLLTLRRRGPSSGGR